MCSLKEIIHYKTMSLPIAIIDFRAPSDAIDRLRKDFTVFLFNAQGVTYDAVCGHPDIFMFQSGSILIIAPNTPKDCIEFLEKNHVEFIFGKSEVGFDLQNSCMYNCVETKSYFFHKKGFTDTVVLEKVKSKMFVSLPQAYTRCSMFPISDSCFITSDKGIDKELVIQGFTVFTLSPDSILLPPYKHGFIGGCFGMYNQKVYVIGSLSKLSQGKELQYFIESNNLEIVELYDGDLYDGGGIFFIS